MQDRKMKALGLFTALSLAVCMAASCIVSDAGSSYAATSSLKWTQISIPDTDGKQLYPGSDIGPMAVASDGVTVFAAVRNEGIGYWELLKSIDGAFSWQNTGLSDAMTAIGDASDIVAVKLSPSWSADGLIFVATQNGVYYSEDRGHTFDDLSPVPGTELITSLDLALDSSGKIIVAVGTADPTPAVGGDVYILYMGGWASQSIGTYDVLAVGFSPNYDSDATIEAVVCSGSQTILRTKYGTAAWGTAISDAIIRDGNGSDLVSYRACIGLPNGYDPMAPSIFVGLSAAPGGDVFHIDNSMTVTDLEVSANGSPSSVNIWSIAVSGSPAGAIVVAGTESISVTPNGSLLVFASLNNGNSWIPKSPSNKQPTGEARATVVQTDSAIYVGTYGVQSAVSVDLSKEYTSWNQRGLIDTNIDEITDMSPSEAYFSDGTMFITTRDATPPGDTSLWRTETGGETWERVFCSTLTAPACLFDMVRIGTDVVIVAESGSKRIWRSLDDCLTFSNRKGTVDIGALLPGGITAFTVGSNSSTYYAGDANGDVSWYDDSIATWTTATLMPSDKVIDLVLWEGYVLVGTDQGVAYFTHPEDFDFHQLGRRLGVAGDKVKLAVDQYTDDFIYAGIEGSASAQGIWRYDLLNEYDPDWEFDWEHIADGSVVGDISSLASDEKYGILYAISSSDEKGYRWVKPTAEEVAQPDEIDNGLDIPAGDSVRRGLKLVSEPIFLFAVGGTSYTQIWTTSDEMVKMKLLAPEDGPNAGTILENEAFLGRAMVELRWERVTGAKSYEVQIAFDEEMDSPSDVVYYDNETQYTEGTVKVVYLWLGTRYYWRARVVAPYMSQWSGVWSFATPLGPAPSIPELISPKAGQQIRGLKPVLQWNSSVAATGYELILAVNCDWNNPVLNLSGASVVSDTAYQLTFNLAKNTSYCWQVRGVNDITHSSWSDTSTFTTGFTAGAENGGLPVWVWVIIALATVFMLSILVLITQSRRF
jgi:hypothetical protein